MKKTVWILINKKTGRPYREDIFFGRKKDAEAVATCDEVKKATLIWKGKKGKR
jgi:hypothetical protein